MNKSLYFYSACIALAFGVFFFVVGGWSFGLISQRFVDNANIAQIKGLLCFIAASVLYTKA